MLGDPNAICDITTTGENRWIVGTNQNMPRCAINVAKNKPAYQSGSPDREDLLSVASKGIKSTVIIRAQFTPQESPKLFDYIKNVLIIVTY